MSIRIAAPAHELPPEKEAAFRKAKRLQQISIAYLISAIALLAVVLGSSQAMKAAWIEDILSLVPPTAFLIANRVRRRSPDAHYPWGYHRAVSIGYLVASFALLMLGAYVLFDSVHKLMLADRPPLGVFPIGGWDPWSGWLMLAALAYTGIPPVFIGRMKLKLADEIHDKVLYADGEMNRADWMTAGAAALGVIGIGIGWWWADAVAGAFISLDIVRDGVRNIGAASADLMDRVPRTYDSEHEDPIVRELRDDLRSEDWVADAEVRVREMGHVYAGEAFVVPADGEDLIGRATRCRTRLLDDHWQLHDIVIVLVDPDDTEKRRSPHARSGTEQSPSAR